MYGDVLGNCHLRMGFKLENQNPHRVPSHLPREQGAEQLKKVLLRLASAGIT